MKKYTPYIVFSFMVISWIIGIYYLTVFYTPTTVIPLFNNFYWTSTFTAMLGLTIAATIISLAALLLLKFRKKMQRWYVIHGFGLFLWMLTISSQLKIAAFNLGICH
ncbi:hypothetical protein ACFOUV_06930 [Oceanobacillus longus]|uniref:Uncharacterized protein n=1 Tax=Oceanobacillus longus TaxID=930120 RepID=A0ABV8GUL1_9BACI